TSWRLRRPCERDRRSRSRPRGARSPRSARSGGGPPAVRAGAYRPSVRATLPRYRRALSDAWAERVTAWAQDRDSGYVPMTTTLSRLKSALRDSQILSRRSLRSLKFDALRLRARLLHQWRTVAPAASRLHLVCGSRLVPGWLNVDVSGSEYDVDLGCGS